MFRFIGRTLVIAIGTVLLSSCATSPEVIEKSDLNQSDAGSVEQVVAAPQISSPDDYILAQGDEISIQVFDEPDLTLDAQVSASGFINYSYLGNIQVVNKTPLQLEQHIAELLRDGYLVNPSVNVAVKNFRPFFIGGEVRSPGSYPYQPGLTLDKAIALAGGLSERASSRRMFIVRLGETDQEKIGLSEAVGPGDTITIQEGFF